MIIKKLLTQSKKIIANMPISVIVCAMIVGLVYVSHNFFIPYFLGSQHYFPVTLSANNDEGLFYGPRANAAYHGQWRAGDINVAEYRDDPSLLPLLNPLFIGIPAQIIGSLKWTFVFSDFIFPALIFVALYFLAFELIQNQSWALLFAVFFIFSPKTGMLPSPDALAFFQKTDALYFTRFEYPKVTFLFYALSFYFTLRVLRRGGLKNKGLAGMFFGLMFYTYLYDWAYFLVGLGILGFLFALNRQWDHVKTIAHIIVIGFLVSVGYWINFLQLHALPHYYDLFLRIGTEVSHHFRFWTVWKSYLRNIVLVVLMAVSLRKTDKFMFNFLTAFLCAYFVVVNAQVMSGFNPQPDHWYRMGFLPIDLTIFVLGFYMFKHYLSGAWAVFFKKAGYVCIVLIFMRGSFSQYTFSKAHAQLYTIDTAYAQSYEWLNSHTPPGSVIGSMSFTTNSELPLFTHNKVFLANGGNSTASNEEIWHRFLLLARVFSLAPEEAISLARENNFYLFHDFYRSHEFDSYFYPRSLVINRAEKDYIDKQEYYKKLISQTSDYPNPYRLDYLYFGPREKELSNDPDGLIKNLNKVYDNDKIIIYAVGAPLHK